MNLEQEFSAYANKLKQTSNTQCQPLNPNEEYVDIDPEKNTYLNIKLVLSHKLIDEMATVAQTLNTNIQEVLSNYLQSGMDLDLTTIYPVGGNQENDELLYDAIYYLEETIDEGLDNNDLFPIH